MLVVGAPISATALVVLLACGSIAQNRPAVSPNDTQASLGAALPTPINYRDVCSLEASVCSCPRSNASPCVDSLPAAMLRPLHLPQVQSSGLCPVTAAHPVKTEAFGGNALGTGPVLPLFSGLFDRQLGGWFGAKTLWFAVPSYSGPALIRGSRIDGPGQVAFGEQPVIGHLILPPGPTLNEASDGYRQAPGGTFIKISGCYAWQVDTLQESYVIVFNAKVVATEP